MFVMNTLSPMKTDEYVAALLKYLNDIIYCESSIIGYDSIVQKNHTIMTKLCVPRLLPAAPSKPEPTIIEPPVPPEEVLVSSSMKNGRFFKAGAAAVACLIPGAPIIAAPIAAYQLIGGRKKDKREAEAATEKKIVDYNQKLLDYEQNKRELDIYYQEQLQEYEQKMSEHREQVNNENLRMSNEAAQKQFYEDHSSRMKTYISKTQATLDRLYGLNIIHMKYHNLTAVTSFYDYLSTGRTTSLVRKDADPGAYNIYEDDVRAGQIISTIGMVGNQIIHTVNSQMNAVRANQNKLCETMQVSINIQKENLFALAGMSENVEKMSESLYDMSSNVENISLNTKDVLVHADAMNRNQTDMLASMESIEKHSKLLVDSQRSGARVRDRDGNVVSYFD